MTLLIPIGTGASDVSRVFLPSEFLESSREADRVVVQVATIVDSGTYKIELQSTLFYEFDPWPQVGTLGAAITDSATAVTLAEDATRTVSTDGLTWNSLRFGIGSDLGETAVVTTVTDQSTFTVTRGTGAVAHDAGTPVFLNTPEHPALWATIATFDSSGSSGADKNKPALIDIAGGALRFRRTGTGTQSAVLIAVS